MKEPWEEDWCAEKDCVVGPELETIFIPWDPRVARIDHPDWQLARDRAVLAAAAPDMARTLLAIEWSYNIPIDDLNGCLVCKAMQHHGHKPGCALDAALKKAGVR